MNFKTNINSRLLARITVFNSVHTLLPVLLFITLIPHLMTTPVIITLYIITILLWFSLHTLSIIALPGQWFRFLMIVFALAILIGNYGIVFSQKASISLLAIMVCLKCLEIKNEQDRRNIFPVIFLGYFILVTHFLHSQDIILGIFALVNTLLLTLMLMTFNRKPQCAMAFKDSLYLLAHLFIKAVPIAIVLFLFFPRVPGPLWSLPADGQTGSTGLSDKMYPGSVTELVDSDEIAFRIDFYDKIPNVDKLYWRGPVLTKTDGFLWSQKKHKALQQPFSEVVKNSMDAVSYTITLEPHQQKWLFALEMPVKVEGDTIKGFYYNNDLQLLNKNNIVQLTQYHVTSMTQFYLTPTTTGELKSALLYPEFSNPRTYKLGKQWRQSVQDKKQIVAKGLNYFKNNPFYYTKRPEIMTKNPSDQFLFDQQRGFCEHYASSFVLLMRAAGVPARVVTGYQGIEKNTIGNYYVVRQSNAHAWAEVWLSGKGWLRVDPTAMIPADRIEDDIFQTNLDRLSFSSLNLPDLPRLSARQKTAMYNFFQQLKQSVDNIKHSWNNWILGYDQTKQSLLLKLMGFNADWQTLIFLLIGGLVLVFIIFQSAAVYLSYKKTDKVYYYYLKFIKKLNQGDLKVNTSEGPQAIAQQAAKRFPQQSIAIKSIIKHYIDIRYGQSNTSKRREQFIKEIKHYKAGKV